MVILTKRFSDILDHYETDYLKFLRRELKVNQHRLDRVRGQMGSLKIIAPSDVRGFLNTLRTSAPSTRNRYRSLLRHIIKWAKDQGYARGTEAFEMLKVERENNERTRRLSKDEEKRLLSAMGTNLRDVFYAALDTGLRRGTLFLLTFGDVSDGCLVVPAAIQKHRKSQRIPLTARLKAIIERRQGEPNELIFEVKGFEYQWNKARAAAGVGDLHWHDLRGEFASRLDEAGVEVSVTSRLLGHAQLTTTQRYLRPRTERFKDAIDKLGV